MRILSVGEVLWDVFPDSERLGGAAFNFSAHARRLGHEVRFLSAVGDDERGRAALERASAMGLPAEHIQTVTQAPTGTVTIQLDREGNPTFTIHRPAAYDCVEMAPAAIEALAAWRPEWIYHGTLHQAEPRMRALFHRIAKAVPSRRFYDINLRRDCYDAPLVQELLQRAHAVKLNEDEAAEVDAMFGSRHRDLEEFCRDWSGRLGWQAVCVTRGEHGCAVLAGAEWAESPGYAVQVVDTVGSGDAFAAAFLHGLSQGWPPARIGDFANRLGAVVASRAGAVPEWTPAECASLGERTASAE